MKVCEEHEIVHNMWTCPLCDKIADTDNTIGHLNDQVDDLDTQIIELQTDLDVEIKESLYLIVENIRLKYRTLS